MIRKLIYLLGVRFRNDLVWPYFDFLCESQYWDIGRLTEYQTQRCSELLEFAYRKTRFYKDKFDTLGVNPQDFKTLDDLRGFPTVTKKELLDRSSDIQIKDGFQKLFLSETSGSTGQPLTFYRNKEWDAWHRAAIIRGYSWYNVKPWEHNGYFWGYNIDPKKARKIKLLDFLQNRFRLFSYKQDEILKFAKKLKSAAYLEGYSSMIYEVAKIIEGLGIGNRLSLKMVKGTSEKIFDRYQEVARKTFGKKIISEYGAAEAGIIAFECAYGNMHITMENVIVEEETNEIIVTNLDSKSFPIIRYKLGDYVELDTKTKCPCGMDHFIIKDVMGRVGNVIYGLEHNYPSLTLYYVFKNLAMEKQVVLNYQAIQKKKGKLQINIEQRIGSDVFALLKKEAVKYFGNDMSIIIKDDQDLAHGKEKVKDFISLLSEEAMN